MSQPPFRSQILRGTVLHRRWSPVEHSFRYSVCYFLFDIDELPLLGRKLPGFGHNRWRPACLFDTDYDRPPRLGLRAGIEEFLERRGLNFRPTRIELLTQPRMAGFVFNPVSYYYCYDNQPTPRCVIAEVNNTFGDRIRYLLDERNAVTDGRRTRYRQPKEMHVSPFMPMNLEYWWSFERRGDRLAVVVDETAEGRGFFHASLHGKLTPLTTRSLWAALVRFPMMSAQIVGLIHWQALRLYLKRAPFWSRPEYVRPVL